MEKNIYAIAVSIFLILSMFSCSSLPGKKDPRTLETRNKAAGYLKDGVTQFNGGRYSRALELFELAYQLNASVDNEAGIVQSLNSMGKTFLYQGDLPSAIGFFQKAMEMALRIGDRQLIQKTKANISDYHIKKGDLDSAYALLEEELSFYGKVDSAESSQLARNLSLVLRKEKKYDDALAWVNKSLQFDGKSGEFKDLAADYYMLASISSLQNNYDAAMNYALKALEYDKMIEYSQGIAADLEALAIISEKTGDLESSAIYNERRRTVIEALKAINQIEEKETGTEIQVPQE